MVPSGVGPVPAQAYSAGSMTISRTGSGARRWGTGWAMASGGRAQYVGSRTPLRGRCVAKSLDEQNCLDNGNSAQGRSCRDSLKSGSTPVKTLRQQASSRVEIRVEVLVERVGLWIRRNA